MNANEINEKQNSSIESNLVNTDSTTNTKAEQKKVGYRDVFTQKEYMKVVLSSIISRFGDSVDAIAFSWLVYAITESAAWTAIIFAINKIPTVLLQPFTGVLVEGMNKKRVMVITDIMRGALVAVMALMLYLDIANPFYLALFTFLISTVEAFCLPAGMALVPRLIRPEYYAFGSSLNSTIGSIMELVGLGLAGVIISFGGVETAMIVDVATFLVSAVILSTIRFKEKDLKKQKLNVKSYMSTLKDGIRYIKLKKVIINFCVMGIVVNALMVPLNSFQSPMAVEIYGLGSELLSVFGIAITVGMMIGTFIFPYILQKVKVLTITVTGGIGVGIGYAMITAGSLFYGQKVPGYIICFIAAFILGMAASMITSVLGVQFVKCVEPEYMARAGAIFNASAQASVPVMSLVLSGLALCCSVGQIFLVCAGLCVIMFVVMGVKKTQLEP